MRAPCNRYRTRAPRRCRPASWRVQVDEETGIDQAGADNYLIAQTPTGAAVSGYNSALCKIEKYTGTALGADADLPARMPLKDGE